MSNYGSDVEPDLVKAQQLAYDLGFVPLDKTNVEQWSHDDGIIVRKLAHKKSGTNIGFKIQN